MQIYKIEDVREFMAILFLKENLCWNDGDQDLCVHICQGKSVDRMADGGRKGNIQKQGICSLEAFAAVGIFHDQGRADASDAADSVCSLYE